MMYRLNAIIWDSFCILHMIEPNWVETYQCCKPHDFNLFVLTLTTNIVLCCRLLPLRLNSIERDDEADLN